MTRSLRIRVLMGGAALVVTALAVFTFVQYRRAQSQQDEIRRIGADWQQRRLLSQEDYVKLRAISAAVVQTRKVSDQELDWLLGKMQQAPSAIVHARVMGILGTLKNPAAPQKERIREAITPLLQSRDDLDRRYALLVQRNLGLAPSR